VKLSEETVFSPEREDRRGGHSTKRRKEDQKRQKRGKGALGILYEGKTKPKAAQMWMEIAG